MIPESHCHLTTYKKVRQCNQPREKKGDQEGTARERGRNAPSARGGMTMLHSFCWIIAELDLEEVSYLSHNLKP